ncbi:Kinesin-related protein 11 [Mactra antiquata]
MDVEFFPFDIQKCALKFGSWTYDGFEIDLVHVCAPDKDSTEIIDNGMDLSDFYQNVEWDIIAVTAQKHIKVYICCIEPYPDVTFNITMRRKTLFHTVNLILPCAVISFLTVLVFYLPSDSEEKITLCISVLLSLTVFFLLLTEIIPPTSIVIPLIGKYLLFTMILVTLSIIVTVFILAVHFRSPTTHVMSPWTRTALLLVLPKMLFMRRPIIKRRQKWNCNGIRKRDSTVSTIVRNDTVHVEGSSQEKESFMEHKEDNDKNNPRDPILTSSFKSVLKDIKFISEHMSEEDDETSVVEDWKFAAMVLDRLFFWVFTLASFIGTFGILLQAPTIYDDTSPITSDTAAHGLC